MGEGGAQPGGAQPAAVVGGEVQQQVGWEPVAVGEAVHRDDRLDEVVSAAQVVGGA